jgi:hypothetical protein
MHETGRVCYSLLGVLEYPIPNITKFINQRHTDSFSEGSHPTLPLDDICVNASDCIKENISFCRVNI